LQISDFHYLLPSELIAQFPTKTRTESKLLFLNKKTGETQDLLFPALIDLLEPSDLLVFNNTHVIPARLYGKKKTGGKIEILIERILSEKEALVHVKSNKKCKIPMEIQFDENINATLFEKDEDFFKIKFDMTCSLLNLLDERGHVPLPPYIHRSDTKDDQLRYQTIYAKIPGAIAAPTAGLHFDESFFSMLKAKKIQTAFVTLHVGSGTFKPVKCENIKDHKMHREWMCIDEDTCRLVLETKKKGGRVIAVGTTSVRCLEAVARQGELRAFSGETDLFIYPGFKFNIVDGLVTNFHLPCSTLLMLVCAFASREDVLRAYQHAVQHRYHFFSYGEAMCIF